ncbi:MAG: RNA polymerase sigma factor [Flavobacteriales bacterium]
MTARTITQVLQYVNEDSQYKELVWRTVRNQTLTNDAYQDLLVAIGTNNNSIHLWNKQQTGTTKDFLFFVTRIATNSFHSESSEHFRKYVRPAKTQPIEYYEDTYSYSLPIEEITLANQITLKDKINNFLNSLNWFDKELFQLYYINHLTYREISKQTKIPLSTLYNYYLPIRESAKAYFAETRL